MARTAQTAAISSHGPGDRFAAASFRRAVIPEAASPVKRDDNVHNIKLIIPYHSFLEEL